MVTATRHGYRESGEFSRNRGYIDLTAKIN